MSAAVEAPATRVGSFAVPGFEARQFLTAGGWALVMAAATWWPAVTFAPSNLTVGLLVMAGVLGFVGYIDAKTKLIPDTYTLVALVVVLVFVLTSGNPISLLPAALTGAGTFLTMILLVFITGFASGGDIKFSPAPAALLAAISPLTSSIWLLLAFLLTLGALVVRMKMRPEDKTGFPMAPLMAAAFPLALIGSALLFASAGR
jgi:Flp pilus assembly protein protease CpaA